MYTQSSIICLDVYYVIAAVNVNTIYHLYSLKWLLCLTAQYLQDHYNDNLIFRLIKDNLYSFFLQVNYISVTQKNSLNHLTFIPGYEKKSWDQKSLSAQSRRIISQAGNLQYVQSTCNIYAEHLAEKDDHYFSVKRGITFRGSVLTKPKLDLPKQAPV